MSTATNPNSDTTSRRPRLDPSFGIYVGNIEIWVDEDQLRTLFSAAGTVHHIQLLGPPGGTYRYGFVDFATPAEQQRAIQMFQGHLLGNRALKVSESRGTSTRPRAEGVGSSYSARPSDTSAYGSDPITQQARMLPHPGQKEVCNWSNFPTQLLKELSRQQYYAALELEHAKLVLQQRHAR